jgi:glycosyltransferase involved in cell wall biosynthesis
MRIGVNLLPLFPGQIGGMERYTFELVTHLMEIDHQHTYRERTRHFSWERTARETLKVLEEAALNGAHVSDRSS